MRSPPRLRWGSTGTSLSLGVANSVLAQQNGALQDRRCALRARRRGRERAAEVLCATFERLGVATGVDVPGVLRAADE